MTLYGYHRNGDSSHADPEDYLVDIRQVGRGCFHKVWFLQKPQNEEWFMIEHNDGADEHGPFGDRLVAQCYR